MFKNEVKFCWQRIYLSIHKMFCGTKWRDEMTFRPAGTKKLYNGHVQPYRKTNFHPASIKKYFC